MEERAVLLSAPTIAIRAAIISQPEKKRVRGKSLCVCRFDGVTLSHRADGLATGDRVSGISPRYSEVPRRRRRCACSEHESTNRKKHTARV